MRQRIQNLLRLLFPAKDKETCQSATALSGEELKLRLAEVMQ